MQGRIRGKVVIVTGASGGIGAEIARAFARDGARIVLSARNVPALESLATELRAGGTETLIVPSDVTSAVDMQHLVRETVAAYGAVDILVCNAGVYVRGAVKDLSMESIRQCMETNYYGAVHLIREALPAMLARRSGHIVAISSVDGKKGLPPDAAYAASKYALTGFMDVLRQELRGTGVYASTIFPERVDTPMIEDLDTADDVPAPPAVRGGPGRGSRGTAETPGDHRFVCRDQNFSSSLRPSGRRWATGLSVSFGLQGVELEKGTSHE